MAPGGTCTVPGSSVETGRSPTITEQVDSTSEKRGEAGVQPLDPADELGQRGEAGRPPRGSLSTPAAARADAQ